MLSLFFLLSEPDLMPYWRRACLAVHIQLAAVKFSSSFSIVATANLEWLLQNES